MIRAVILAAALAGTTAAGDVPDLTGTWVLDPVRSDYGDMPGPKAEVDTFARDGARLRLGVASTVRRRTRAYVLDFPTDGTWTPIPQADDVRVGPTTLRAVSAAWRPGALALTERLQHEDETFVIDNLYSVSKDGRTLSVQVRLQNGERLAKMVFRRADAPAP